jgi:hypothetical protein
MLHQQERRVSRSDNLYEALELQLAATARRARFTSIILTDEQGLTVASCGNAGEAEDIAVLSPQLAPGGSLWQGKIRSGEGMNRLVTVAPFNSDAGRLFLCAVGGIGSCITSELLMGGRGVSRILA